MFTCVSSTLLFEKLFEIRQKCVCISEREAERGEGERIENYF